MWIWVGWTVAALAAMILVWPVRNAFMPQEKYDREEYHNVSHLNAHRFRPPPGARAMTIWQYLPAPYGSFWREVQTLILSGGDVVIDFCDPWVTEDHLVVTYR